MSDNLKDAGIVLFSLAMIAGFANWRAEHAIVHDLGRNVKGGELHAYLATKGDLGTLIGQADSVVVKARGFSSDGFPLRMQRGTGLRAYVRTLKLDFQDITLHGIPVRQFQADIPRVSLDIGRAFFDERVVIRSAGEGTAEAVVESAAMRDYLQKKFPQFSEVVLTLTPGQARIEGDMLVLGSKSKVEAVAKLGIVDGRYVQLVEPALKLNGKPLTPAFAQSLLKSVNPVMDLEKDLGLSGYFTATEVVIGEGRVTVKGIARVPAPAPGSPSVSAKTGRRQRPTPTRDLERYDPYD